MASGFLDIYDNPALRIKIIRMVVISFIAGFMLFFAGAQTSAQERPQLMVYGDSLVAGYGLPPEQSFPSQLQAALESQNIQIEVLNAGVSGDTTAGGRSRLEWSLADKPDGIIVVLGGNDMLRGLDPQAAFDNLDAILSKLNSAQIPVLLCGMLASVNLGAEYQQVFDAIYPKLAAKHDVLLYPFFLDGVALLPELNQRDGIHPSPQGVAVIISKMQPHIDQLLVQMGVE